MKACCMGCKVPAAFAKPSMVVTSRPSFLTAKLRHDKTRRSSTRTLHAPLAVIATFFGSGQANMLTQGVEQCCAAIKGQSVISAIDTQPHGNERIGIRWRLHLRYGFCVR